jgi:FkbM family methyltransferase
MVALHWKDVTKGAACMVADTRRMPGVFAEFQPWRGCVPARHCADFLGQLYDSRFFKTAEYPATDYHAATDYPMPSEEIFEWIALLEAVLAARDTFVMMDLGAGYGRWSVAAACAIRRRRPELKYHLVAVEAEPTHFAWLKQHFRTNGINPDMHTLIEAAVNGSGEPAPFTVGHPQEWYGQAIVPEGSGFGNWPEARVVRVNAVTLPQLLTAVHRCDLIHMDIQGAELECIESSIDELTVKTRRVHVATHSVQIDERLERIFTGADWQGLALYGCGSHAETPFGQVPFQDGIQYWLNPLLGDQAVSTSQKHF